MFATGQSNFLQALGSAVLNSLWQMALLWVVYQLATALLRNLSSSQKRSLAVFFLFSGFGWFAFTFFALLADSPAAQIGAFVGISGDTSIQSWVSKILPFGSIVYLVLLVFPVFNFIRNYRYVKTIRTSGLIKAEVRWRMFVQKIAGQMTIKRKVSVWVSDIVNSPVTVGYLKPIILLPAAAVNNLTVNQVEAVLLHELSHIRNADYLVNLITRMIQTILYFNPFVRAFSTIIETEREKSCDEMVLQFQYDPYGYASALLALEKAIHLPKSLAVAASGGRKNELMHRIECILGIKKPTFFSYTKVAGVVAALICFISLNAVLLLSKTSDTKLSPALLNDVSGPFAFVSPEKEDINAVQLFPADEIAKGSIIGQPVARSVNSATGNPSESLTSTNDKKESAPVKGENQTPVSDALHYVNYTENVVPQLDAVAEKQVEEAMAASKKVLAEDQWKVMEKSIADALTEHEKEKLKTEYKKALNQIDWKQIQEKLKIAYEEINWNKVNSQLSTALTEIKLDSLQNVYSIALGNLSTIQRELLKADQNCVPDTEINLKSLDEQKKEVQKTLNRIKEARGRKVVHL